MKIHHKRKNNSRNSQELIEQQFQDDCMKWEKYRSLESRYELSENSIAVSTHTFRCLPDNKRFFVENCIGDKKWIMYNLKRIFISRFRSIVNINVKPNIHAKKVLCI